LDNASCSDSNKGITGPDRTGGLDRLFHNGDVIGEAVAVVHMSAVLRPIVSPLSVVWQTCDNSDNPDNTDLSRYHYI
ncbi:hypothetical protein J6590_023064, partial [Homalodisca vitripennis]